MDVSKMTPAEIRRAGIEALARALGPVGMVRFMQQFEKGSGDYTEERRSWLGNPDVDALVEEIEQRRADQESRNTDPA